MVAAVEGLDWLEEKGPEAPCDCVLLAGVKSVASVLSEYVEDE